MIYVGVDGCNGKWLAVAVSENLSPQRMDVFQKVEDLWDTHNNASLICIDMPIGLKDTGPDERRCDTEARRLLGWPRRCSVFPVPCRSAAYAEPPETPTEINYRLTGRRLSCQTCNIVEKIREVDTFLLGDAVARQRFREIHPEVCFWALAAHPMHENKKKERGFQERKAVLEAARIDVDSILDESKSRWKLSEVAADDVLDALVAAVTASQQDSLVSIPQTPEYDEKGLRMEMVYAHRSASWRTMTTRP